MSTYKKFYQLVSVNAVFLPFDTTLDMPNQAKHVWDILQSLHSPPLLASALASILGLFRQHRQEALQ